MLNHEISKLILRYMFQVIKRFFFTFCGSGYAVTAVGEHIVDTGWWKMCSLGILKISSW